jgi:hypothetical protein
MRILITILLVSFLVQSVAAKNEVKKAAKQVDKILKVDGNGKGKGGKPIAPGAQGRVNAEVKKATNPGQGGGKNNSLEGALLDGLIDDNDKGGKKKGKKKGKKD